jgi:hypothetical protein
MSTAVNPPENTEEALRLLGESDPNPQTLIKLYEGTEMPFSVLPSSELVRRPHLGKLNSRA